MTAPQYQQVSVYINEGDEWRRRPLHLEILRMLHREGLAGGKIQSGLLPPASCCLKRV